MKLFCTYLLPIEFFCGLFFCTNTDHHVLDFLNTGDLICYRNIDYKLAWSSHPAINYYIQEYIRPDDSLASFNSLLLIKFLAEDVPPIDVVEQKIDEIEARKATDKVAGYRLRRSPDKKEYLLDFILSSGSGDKIGLIEFDSYRYVSYTDKSGRKGVLLYGRSLRAYNDDMADFIQELKRTRERILNEFNSSEIPVIQLN